MWLEYIQTLCDIYQKTHHEGRKPTRLTITRPIYKEILDEYKDMLEYKSDSNIQTFNGLKLDVRETYSVSIGVA